MVLFHPLCTVHLSAAALLSLLCCEVISKPAHCLHPQCSEGMFNDGVGHV